MIGGDPGARVQDEIGTEHGGDGIAGPEFRHPRVARCAEQQGHRRLRQHGDEAADEVEDQVPERPERVLDVLAEDHQEQHVAQNVVPTSANTGSRFQPGLAWPAVTAIAQDNASKDAIAFPFLVTRSGLGARRYGGTPMATPDATKNGPGSPAGAFRPITLPVKLHHPVVLEEQARRASDLQLRIADWITSFAGSMNFVYLHVVLFTVWMLFIEKSPWPTLTLVVSLEAIFLSTFVMIGQNRQAAFQQAKADHDFNEQELELKTNTQLTREIDRLTAEVHRRVVGTPPAQEGEHHER
jgi:hypothetical protein